MPCKKYNSKKQKSLCFLTNEWKDFSKIRNMKGGKNKMYIYKTCSKCGRYNGTTMKMCNKCRTEARKAMKKLRR